MVGAHVLAERIEPLKFFAAQRAFVQLTANGYTRNAMVYDDVPPNVLGTRERLGADRTQETFSVVEAHVSVQVRAAAEEILALRTLELELAVALDSNYVGQTDVFQ